MSEQLELFRTLEKDFNFELTPCDKNFDLDTKSGYILRKLLRLE